MTFDNPSNYHLYFADPAGTLGTVMTYFPFPSRVRGYRGIGEVAKARFAVSPDSLDFWEDRLKSNDVKKITRVELFSSSCLEFVGPNGENLAICEQDRAILPPADGHIASRVAISRFHSAQLCVDRSSNVGNLLVLMGLAPGLRDGDTQRFQLRSFGLASIVDMQ